MYVRVCLNVLAQNNYVPDCEINIDATELVEGILLVYTIPNATL